MSSENYRAALHETNSDSFLDITNSSNHHVMFIDDNSTPTCESIDVKSYFKLPLEKEQHLNDLFEKIKASKLEEVKMEKNKVFDILKEILKFDKNLDNLNNLIDFFYKYEKNDHYLLEVIPKMADLVLDLPNIIKKPIPILKSGQTHSISFNQKQCASILANAFFCTFPNDRMFSFADWYAKSKHKEVNQVKIQKIKCLLHYFDRIIQKDEKDMGNITFCRFSQDFDIKTISNSENEIRFPSISNEKTIEECKGQLQVDFANRYIGGGVLNSGCVQEEIRFLMCPELIVSMLFMDPMANNECIIIRGSEQFSKYSGYAWSFKWSGNFEDNTQKDKCGRKMTDVLAIDALCYHDSRFQYQKDLIEREITKAYIGFSSGANQLPIASGNWGCGAFNGDIQLKFIIQLIAASQAKRDLHYCTFHDKEIEKVLNDIIDDLRSKNFTVSSLHRCLIQFCSSGQKSFREFLKYH